MVSITSIWKVHFKKISSTITGFINNNVKDIKDLTENKRIKVDGDESDTEEDYVVGLETTLAGTRDAFNERGERLNILRDKSAA
jgi:hypothetical protein